MKPENIQKLLDIINSENDNQVPLTIEDFNTNDSAILFGNIFEYIDTAVTSYFAAG